MRIHSHCQSMSVEAFVQARVLDPDKSSTESKARGDAYEQASHWLAQMILRKWERAFGADAAVELLHTRGREMLHGVVILPSAKRPGWWQLQRFDVKGFLGDSQFPTKLDAIEEAVLLGYCVIRPGSLQNAMQSGCFIGATK